MGIFVVEQVKTLLSDMFLGFYFLFYFRAQSYLSLRCCIQLACYIIQNLWIFGVFHLGSINENSSLKIFVVSICLKWKTIH